MLILYSLLGILLYILLVFIIGKVTLSDKIKRNIFEFFSTIYNAFLGYFDTYFVLLLYGYFTNRPKGSGYEVPNSEAGFNIMLGILAILIYLALLIPFNIYMKKKGGISLKKYIFINGIATTIGIIVFWVFLDKSQILF